MTDAPASAAPSADLSAPHPARCPSHGPASFRVRLAVGVGSLLLAMLLSVILVQNISLDWAFQHQVDTIATGSTQTIVGGQQALDAAGDVPDHAQSCDGSQCSADDQSTVPGMDSTGQVMSTGTVLTIRDSVVQWMRYGSLAIFAAASLLSVLLVWRLSGRLTARLDSISQQASRLDPDHPTGRIRLDDPDAETASLAAALNAMLDRIEQSNDLQRSFIRNAGHELKTPITTIGTSLEALMAQDRFPEDVQPAIRHAIDANRKSGELITSLLELSRIQTAPDTGTTSVDVGETMRDVIAAHNGQAAEHHITIDMDAPGFADSGGVSPTVTTSPRYLRLAVDNLIRNAVIHNTDNGAITCTVQAGENHTIITIDNTTRPPENAADAEDLIQPFHRGDDTRMANRPGHGLGLSIAKACTDVMQATLAVSRPSPGTFRAEIKLPNRPTQRHCPQQKEHGHRPHAGQ